MTRAGDPAASIFKGAKSSPRNCHAFIRSLSSRRPPKRRTGGIKVVICPFWDSVLPRSSVANWFRAQGSRVRSLEMRSGRPRDVSEAGSGLPRAVKCAPIGKLTASEWLHSLGWGGRGAGLTELSKQRPSGLLGAEFHPLGIRQRVPSSSPRPASRRTPYRPVLCPTARRRLAHSDPANPLVGAASQVGASAEPRSNHGARMSAEAGGHPSPKPAGIWQVSRKGWCTGIFGG